MQACPLAECTDGEFRLPAEVYFPEAHAAPVLGRTVFVALIPDERRKAVGLLLDWLDVARRPRVKDVLARITELTAEPPTPTSQVAIHRVVSHLVDRWIDEKSPDDWKDLRNRSWLLAQDDESRWYRPSELHANYSHHLFYRSRARFLNLDHGHQKAGRDLLDFLGVKTTEPSVGLVVEHLLYCAKTEEKVNSQVWWFLDRHNEDPALNQLVGQRCLLLEDDTYVTPESVFLKDHGLGRLCAN